MLATTSTKGQMMQIGLGGAIFLVFLVLKLIGTLTWSWWWITSPLWIMLILETVLQSILVFFNWRYSQTLSGRIDAYSRSLRGRR